MITYREAHIDEADIIHNLIWNHGPNQWNHLTQDGINFAIELFRLGQAGVIVAVSDNEIVGLAMNISTEFIPESYAKYGALEHVFFIGDVVVDQTVSGKGIGSTLLKESLKKAKALTKQIALIERHEENLASAGMMRKAGFKQLDCFLDLSRRTAGSQKTVVMGYMLDVC